jgi:hypothetical protein
MTNIGSISLRKLKEKLAQCDKKDISRLNLIKKLIKAKEEYLVKKQKEIQVEESIRKKEADDLLDKIFGEMEEKQQPLQDTHKFSQDDETDMRLKDQVKYDYTNNRLMDRMNSELDIRINGRNKREIIKPYADSSDLYSYKSQLINSNDYVDINDDNIFGIPNTNFSTVNIINRMK